ncbi:hypothetical protein LEP1GSC199_2401 [Leptospira vanthielii serovar Holland str. Waz Holland = ATCC 700522]|uniref:Uncharacterized protein n=1 Tax=Leptospira vanthielii serovar Holland str. Waz Holland = ATCC 700522 TaxID=1218591 RepID=N1W4W8_9LEPT|nr:hypothetical protein LEP1GSC199_2401 [Leptospira vanthielii serovar Holland str. Waz Holland = ATCC 700522]
MVNGIDYFSMRIRKIFNSGIDYVFFVAVTEDSERLESR